MRKYFNKDEIIIRQGDRENRNLYLVIEGKLKVKRVSGNSLIDCGHLLAGDVFGEMSLILGVERGATIVAEEKTTLEQLNREEFLAYIQDHPHLAWQVLKNLAIRTQKLDEIQGQIFQSKVILSLLTGK
ncbi:MAG: cyclic nucleotide-binding domain-containing protein [Spirochaetes bacterium]|nr:cyclic nucleotide-binding domain-containing protein [Spirochaetota bacterium]